MSDRLFDSPVFVTSGKSLVQEIACLEDALEFLYEWPKSQRGVTYETGLKACQRAFDSDYPLSAARDAFVRFAKEKGIFEDASMPLPWMVISSGPGGMPA
jgi:hypothetical protein